MSKRGIIMKKKSENLENNIKGKEISETIEKYVKKASNVFIIGHKRPDYDFSQLSLGGGNICCNAAFDALCYGNHKNID